MSERTIRQWTEDKQKDLEGKRNRLIIELYLKAENTQEIIAEKMNVDRLIVTRTIQEFVQNGKFAEMNKYFKPFMFSAMSVTITV